MSRPKVDFLEFSGWFYCENGRSQKWPQNGSKRPLAMRKKRLSSCQNYSIKEKQLSESGLARCARCASPYPPNQIRSDQAQETDGGGEVQPDV